MTKLLSSDTERVRVICPYCGRIFARVVRDQRRSLVLVRKFQTWDQLGPRPTGTSPKAVHQWERIDMGEGMSAILNGTAGSRIEILAAHCDCKRAGEFKLSIDYRSLAPHLAEAERTGRVVKWKLDADDREFAQLWNRSMTTLPIPEGDWAAMRRRRAELDPTMPTSAEEAAGRNDSGRISARRRRPRPPQAQR